MRSRTAARWSAVRPALHPDDFRECFSSAVPTVGLLQNAAEPQTMEHELNDDDDPVGYKRPPRKHQFPKGKSGNPKGRPRKTRPDTSNETLAETLKRIGEEKVEIKGQTMTLNELGIRSLFHKVAAGNVQAAKHLQSLRKEAGANKARGGGGVLVVPGMVPIDEWSIAVARQQAKFRGEDPEGLARLEEEAFGKKLPPEDDL